MSWRQRMRALWPFGRPANSQEAREAQRRASLSHQRARSDLRHTARLRAEADAVADRLKAHNEANRYDDWLRRVVQGRD